MYAIVELAFRESKNLASDSLETYFEEGETLEKSADGYFTDRPSIGSRTP